MFLALKEIRHEKLRYGLIIGMILLISYLVYVLSGLAYGLAQQNTQAVDSWQAQSIALDRDSNVSLSQSLITTQTADKLTLNRSQAYLGQAGIVAKATGKTNLSAQFLGLNRRQFIYRDLKLTAGHKPQSDRQVVVDTAFQQKGYRLGDRVTLNSAAGKYTIVGFTKNAKLNVAPVVYGTLTTWRTLRGVTPAMKASAIVSQKADQSVVSPLKTYSVATFVNNLPGYSAQNTTFTFMIGFLMIIAVVVIAVFLYILTMQKLPNYAVLRAQGIPARFLVSTTLGQAVVLVVSGLALGALLTLATMRALPLGVPISFNLPLLAGVTGGILLTGVLGALIPVKLILKVDPVTVIGG
ncbi:ABC transporter permease [Levilactobacillus spicheri]|uniref:Putative hemin transport system permease protein HrtB n=2 Tax=Levilactobacillus spicheri TaxID=216463 RepID=A0A0F3RT73_9LACO|nr:ABC transporter permease [Levilactobacillus spicheri]KJW12784.1 ABC transporter permease [Levilactobacillus spicheri]KRL50629.1 peptide ABC transporter permease [Levilactobacillus spicheri DSM 15429]GEO66843.1 peptide ABC transporter permease [Levilactobacillus spicheri]